MKRAPPPAQVAAALAFQDVRPRLHRVWIVALPDGRKVERSYQWPVCKSRVLADHAAAVAAEPIG